MAADFIMQLNIKISDNLKLNKKVLMLLLLHAQIFETEI